jgi:hypothetical protein
MLFSGLDLPLELSFLLFDGLKFRPNAFPFRPAGSRFSGVLLVCLGTAHPFLFGSLVTDFGAA